MKRRVKGKEGERVRGSPRFHLDGKGKLNEKRERRGRKGKRRTRGEEAFHPYVYINKRKNLDLIWTIQMHQWSGLRHLIKRQHLKYN